MSQWHKVEFWLVDRKKCWCVEQNVSQLSASHQQYVFVLIFHFGEASLGTTDFNISRQGMIHFWVNVYLQSDFNDQMSLVRWTLFMLDNFFSSSGESFWPKCAGLFCFSVAFERQGQRPCDPSDTWEKVVTNDPGSAAMIGSNSYPITIKIIRVNCFSS